MTTKPRKTSQLNSLTAHPATPPTTAPSTAVDMPQQRVAWRMDRAAADRMRAAVFYTMTTEGHRSLTDWLTRTVTAEVERLERDHNNGEPFPAIGELPRGRR